MPNRDTEFHPAHNNFSPKISNVAQLGGIETSVIDNGPARGTRIAWFNTGTGLRFKVVADRAMDIADAFYNEHSIAWLSHTGITPPQPLTHGTDWLRMFGGGLLTTCGLSHVGGPEKDESGERGIHGYISNTAAEIISINQPDPASGNMDMSMTGKMKETTIFGPSLELKRTISCTLGKPWLNIHDVVINRGNTPAPHMLLYHFNFGWPVADEGADLVWKGDMHLLNNNENIIFNSKNNYKKCVAPMEEHRGTGESVAAFDIHADSNGECVCGIHNEVLELAVTLTFKKTELPWLTNWQHWGPGEYVTGIEPGTHPPVGQARARRENNLIFIQPGESRSYNVKLAVLNDTSSISNFLKNNN
jgi:hypothetical protein